MKLKHTYENLIIENYKKFTMMIIYYNGVFEGTINSSFVLDKNKIYVFDYNENKHNILLEYVGDFTINKVLLNANNVWDYVFVKKDNEKIDNLKSVWSLSTTKYNYFSKTKTNINIKKTIITKRK